MSTTADQLHELGARWIATEIAGDTATLEAIVTDDFRLVGPFGFVLDKDQWLDRYRSGDFTTSQLTWQDVAIRDYGDTAVTIRTQIPASGRQGHTHERRLPDQPRVHSTRRAVDDRWHTAQPHLPAPAVS
jgi:hypothetical protein